MIDPVASRGLGGGTMDGRALVGGTTVFALWARREQPGEAVQQKPLLCQLGRGRLVQ